MAAPQQATALGAAIDAFLAPADLAASSRRSCAQTLKRLAAELDPGLELSALEVDVLNRRPVVRSKGGDIELLHFQTGSARLLPRMIAGRARGPLFFTDRRPVPGRAPAIVDVCPVTGCPRLSYRRAQELFAEASGGWTLHQLRHSAITHLAEGNVGLALLMAKSRHTSLRSVQRYARPGAGAGADADADDRGARSRPPPALSPRIG